MYSFLRDENDPINETRRADERAEDRDRVLERVEA